MVVAMVCMQKLTPLSVLYEVVECSPSIPYVVSGGDAECACYLVKSDQEGCAVH